MLERIVAHKKREIASLLPQAAALEKKAKSAPRPRDFVASLASRHPAIIAELKRKSPSKGIIREDFDPRALAQRLSPWAAAFSVLTDEVFFGGNLGYIALAKEAAPRPVLRKDFILSPVQVYEARAAGADAILLIARILDPREMRLLAELAFDLGMAVLLEAHDERDLEMVLDIEGAVLGINSRNLATFRTDVGKIFSLLPLIPKDRFVVAESGISTAEDIQNFLQTGRVGAFLVGEALMRASDPALALQDLLKEAT